MFKIGLQGRHGLAHLLPKRYPISTPDEMSKTIPPPEYVAPTKGEDGFLELSDDFFEHEVNVAKGNKTRHKILHCPNNKTIICFVFSVTNLKQRLNQLETQPLETSALLPTHKQLLVKRS